MARLKFYRDPNKFRYVAFVVVSLSCHSNDNMVIVVVGRRLRMAQERNIIGSSIHTLLKAALSSSFPKLLNFDPNYHFITINFWC